MKEIDVIIVIQEGNIITQKTVKGIVKERI